jgi:DNA polymerase-3 subunit epsilon
MAWWRRSSLELRRQWWRRRVAPGPLRDYLDVPTLDLGTDWREVDYLVLDFETTGVDPDVHEILSAGYLDVVQQAVRLETTCHRLVRPEGALTAKTVVIHGITHDLSAEGLPEETVLGELLVALTGRVLVGHHVATEVNFLSRACRRLYGAPFVGPAIDTLALELGAMRRAGLPPKRGELRLGGARARRGLPRYRAHNALIDALATAELFLAQATDLGTPRLGELLAKG